MVSTRGLRLASAGAALMLVLAQARLARAALTTLDFEDVRVGRVITREYLRFGVTFRYGIPADTTPIPHSGNRVLHFYQPELEPLPVVIDFSADQSHVQLFAGTGTPGNAPLLGTLRAFDAQGRMLLQDGPKAVTGQACTTPFRIDVATPSIRRVELAVTITLATGTFLTDIALDDLELGGNAPPPTTTTPPVVSILSPGDGAEMDASVLTLVAKIKGDKLPGMAGVTLVYGEAETKSHHAPTERLVPIQNVNNERVVVVALPLSPGPQTLTVDVLNQEGLRGDATIRFTNLPKSIRDRFSADGGASKYGDLKWAAVGSCTVAVYSKGAIGSGTAALAITGAIFGEWLDWILARYDQYVWPQQATPLCPAGDARMIYPYEAAPGVLAQDFNGGRIYAAPQGVYYVPQVFAAAIDALGGEKATGVPIGRPQRAPTTRTWLFQRFRRMDSDAVKADSLASTMEIKGDPPTLWVERQGGSRHVLQKNNILSFDALLDAKTPTLWEHFACYGREGPCLTGYSNLAIQPIPRVCGTLDAGSVTPEWAPVNGHYTMTTLQGIAARSERAEEDLITTHELYYNQDFDGNAIRGYWSDWNVDVFPIGDSRRLSGLLIPIEVEFEYGRAAHFFSYRYAWDATQPGGALPNRPLIGDLIFTAGRWIRDCGHAPFDTEIHPPFVWAHMRTVPATPTDFNRSGSPTTVATVANIWVTGWYPGDPLDVDIFPPPRPSPVDFMNIFKPRDSDTAVDVNVSFTTDPEASTYVRVHFTSPTVRHVDIDGAGGGEMHFKNGRGYAGRWIVEWEGHTGIPVTPAGQLWWP